jgi:2-polyprenyl-3-methyl-5-hydroxy-6-metoxy-1,4-benzoquinol methylase
MTDTDFEDTIDWNRFWATADEDDRESATPSSHHVRGLLADLFAEKAVPDSVADVGCGPGVVAFDVATSHPETTVVGYDAAESVLAENRDRATTEGLSNLAFERAVLPAFDPDRSFDLVLCFGTLTYVAETQRAVRNLYDAVAPGGHLVLGYVNQLGAAHYQEMLTDPETTGAEIADPERFEERFHLALEGESVLSYERIHEATGTWPRSFWEFTDKPEERWAWRHAPLVWLPK